MAKTSNCTLEFRDWKQLSVYDVVTISRQETFPLFTQLASNCVAFWSSWASLTSSCSIQLKNHSSGWRHDGKCCQRRPSKPLNSREGERKRLSVYIRLHAKVAEWNQMCLFLVNNELFFFSFFAKRVTFDFLGNGRRSKKRKTFFLSCEWNFRVFFLSVAVSTPKLSWRSRQGKALGCVNGQAAAHDVPRSMSSTARVEITINRALNLLFSSIHRRQIHLWADSVNSKPTPSSKFTFRSRARFQFRAGNKEASTRYVLFASTTPTTCVSNSRDTKKESAIGCQVETMCDVCLNWSGIRLSTNSHTQ